jgi:hypothetical protein
MGGDDATTPVAYEDNSSNDLDNMMHARCYCDRAHLSVTQHTNGHSEVIYPLLLILRVNR